MHYTERYPQAKNNRKRMKLEFIKEQIEWVDNWTSNLISDIDETDCGIVENLDTSINWQIGHIIISKYFHSVQSIMDKDSGIIYEINKKVPINDLFKYYFAGSNPLEIWKNRPNKNQLLKLRNEIDLATNRTLETLTENTLAERTEIGNPVAKTKYEALTFTFKHQMWHNGQIAMIKRIIG